MHSFNSRRMQSAEAGFSLVEAIFAIGLFSIIIMGIVKSSVLTSSTINRSINNTEAMRIAQQTIEDLYLQEPEALSEDNSFSDTVVVDNYSFKRDVAVSINDDRSRTINVTVEGANSKSGGKAVVVTSLAMRGTR